MAPLDGLCHRQLLSRLHDLIRRDHSLEAELISHLGEVDARRLYLEQACSSMFHFCVHVLHFAECVAYKRITVARAARRFPELREALAAGDIHLTGASLIAPHLEPGCAPVWVEAARRKTAREIKAWIAERKPKPSVASSVRRVAERRQETRALFSESQRPRPEAPSPQHNVCSTPSQPTPPSPPKPPKPPTPSTRETGRSRSEPLGANRYCVRFEANERVHNELEELRSLLRHQIPDGDVAKIIARAISGLVVQVRKQKIGTCASPRSPRKNEREASSNNAAVTSRPASKTAGVSSQSLSRDGGAPSKHKPPSRHIPASIRRAVWSRDGGRCSFESMHGRRCDSREFLEFHHQVPWARCREHSTSNIQLRCRAHNQYEAELDFGVEHMAASRSQGRAPAEIRAGECKPAPRL